MKEIQLYTPYNKQVEVHKGLDDESCLFTCVCAGRQTGKTMLSMNQALKWALEYKNAVIMWVSPTHSQINKVYKEVIKAIGDTPAVKTHKASQGETEIEFTTGSVIKFKSAAAEDNLRGETVHFMIIDEAAFVKQTTFNEILLPMLNVAGKKCLIVSTPKGRSNWFHKQYIKGKAKRANHQSFHFSCYDNPFANETIIDTAKEDLPEALFKQEYLGEFIDGGSVFQNINQVCTLKPHLVPKEGGIYYAGIDLALKNDYTVLTIVDAEGNLIYMDRFSGVSSPELKERIAKKLKLWKPQNTLIELNNLGQAIYDDLVHLYAVKNLQGWTTTNKTKNEIIARLVNAFSSQEIKCINDEDLKSELETFQMNITPSGNVRYEAASGFHDDTVMSLAIARKAQETSVKNRFNLRFVG